MSTRARRRDVRPLAIVVVLVATSVGGLVADRLPLWDFRTSVETMDGSQPPNWPSAWPPLQQAIEDGLEPDARKEALRWEEIDLRMRQATFMLHSRQFEHAVVALDRALQLQPALVEAHVNMGFALLGLERETHAVRYFETALRLRPMQANAYYGLGVALNELGDAPAAVSAMRTYLHLGDPADTHRERAAAMAEGWEQTLRGG